MKVQNLEDMWAKTSEMKLANENFSPEGTQQEQGAAELTESQQQVQTLFRELQDQIALNKKMEAEISAMKAKIDEARGGQRKQSSEETTVTTKAKEVEKPTASISEKQWEDFFMRSGLSREQVQAKFAEIKADKELKKVKAEEEMKKEK
jgi:hypothetical protein